MNHHYLNLHNNKHVDNNKHIHNVDNNKHIDNPKHHIQKLNNIHKGKSRLINLINHQTNLINQNIQPNLLTIKSNNQPNNQLNNQLNN